MGLSQHNVWKKIHPVAMAVDKEEEQQLKQCLTLGKSTGLQATNENWRKVTATRRKTYTKNDNRRTISNREKWPMDSGAAVHVTNSRKELSDEHEK
jgi:hypothetical protein